MRIAQVLLLLAMHHCAPVGVPTEAPVRADAEQPSHAAYDSPRSKSDKKHRKRRLQQSRKELKSKKKSQGTVQATADWTSDGNPDSAPAAITDQLDPMPNSESDSPSQDRQAAAAKGSKHTSKAPQRAKHGKGRAKRNSAAASSLDDDAGPAPEAVESPDSPRQKAPHKSGAAQNPRRRLRKAAASEAAERADKGQAGPIDDLFDDTEIDLEGERPGLSTAGKEQDEGPVRTQPGVRDRPGAQQDEEEEGRAELAEATKPRKRLKKQVSAVNQCPGVSRHAASVITHSLSQQISLAHSVAYTGLNQLP